MNLFHIYSIFSINDRTNIYNNYNVYKRRNKEFYTKYSKSF